ncbi:MAG: O-antigen polymerase [Patescibacteria group bacterium]
MRKFLPYIIIFIALVGLFSPVGKAHAQAPSPATVAAIAANSAAIPAVPEDTNQLANNLPVCTPTSFTVEGCLTNLLYYIFIPITSLLLYLSGMLFNAMVALTLSSKMYSGSTFIPSAWAVVRDLSNIFFILILLYIAIQIILGLGGANVKKMIAKVIITALLINFSMFFTEVVIDSSNILALVFYNKINVETSVDGQPRAYIPATNLGEKDISGGFTSAFNPSKLLSREFFEKAKQPVVASFSPMAAVIVGPLYLGAKLVGFLFGSNAPQVPASLVMGIIVVSGLIMLFAAYAFFIASISFLSRLIELWILIIFSPFAFMSSSVPKLSGIEYVGWDAWFKRLLTVAFMAPIFMFFMYVIFLIVRAKMFDNIARGNATGTTNPQTWMEIMLFIVISALVLLILLLKATSFAKKGSGALGEALMKGLKVVGGVALGATVGGAAIAGRATVGRAGAAIAESEWAKRREREGKFGSTLIRSGAKAVGTGSFDVRGVKIAGKDLAGATGMHLGEAQKGGFTERKKEQVEKRQKRAKELQVGEDEPLTQALHQTEMDLQGLLGENAQVIETLDKVIEKKRQEVNDAEKKFNAAKGTTGEGAARAALTTANGDLDFAKENKKDFRGGRNYMLTNSAGVSTIETGTGTDIEALEGQKRAQAQAIKTENVRRNRQYAETEQTGWSRAKGFVFSGGTYTKSASREAAHDIVMETKLESGTRT